MIAGPGVRSRERRKLAPCEAMRPEGRVTAYAPGDAHRRFHLGDQYNQCPFPIKIETLHRTARRYVLRSGRQRGL
jgi:hypothetical protein